MVLPSIIVGNDCTTLARFPPTTFTLDPTELSTLGRDSVPTAYNFGDLPCFPSDKLSRPMLSPFPQLHEDPQQQFLLSKCGYPHPLVDPPSILPTATAPSIPHKKERLGTHLLNRSSQYRGRISRIANPVHRHELEKT